MSASGSGRYARIAQLCDEASEPIPDPREQAEFVLTELLDSAPAAQRILRGLERAGLAVCWAVEP